MKSNVYTRNGDELILNLHEGQLKAYDSQARFTFVIAGSQSGKTSFAPIWLFQEILARGPGDYLAVSATYDLFKLKMLPEMLGFFQDVFRWNYNKSEKVLHHPTDGSRIILRSAESSGGLESATAKAAVLDECGLDSFTIDTWDAVQRRLTLNQGRVLGTTTPYNMGWLKREIYDRWTAGDKDYNVIQFRSTMNPAFPQSEYDRIKKIMPGWKFSMFYDGEFTRPAGMIYGDFNKTMEIDDFSIPDRWNISVGIDPGAVNTALIWVATDPISGIHYIVKEDLIGDMTTKEQVNNMQMCRYFRHGMRVWGGAPSEKQFRSDYTDAGITVIQPDVSDVESGIDRVTMLMKTDKLRVFKSCRGLLSEIGSYARVLTPNGDPTEEIKDKKKYHRLDALRYLACGLTTKARSLSIGFLGNVNPR